MHWNYDEKASTLRSETKHHEPIVVTSGGGGKRAYGFFPQMKAEGMAFKEEKAGAVLIGTNPGYQNGVLVVYEDSDGDEIRRVCRG